MSRSRHIEIGITTGKHVGFLVYEAPDLDVPVAALSTADEVGQWIAERLRQVDGVTIVDAPEMPQLDPVGRRAWFPRIIRGK